MNLLIRREVENDHRTVEGITRKAFWNLHGPGCDEHYLVHIMRRHPDFIPELDFVIELEGQVIGNIMYTKSTLSSDKGENKAILTFGPVSITPEHQRKGYGKHLINFSFQQALKLGYDTVVIFGKPGNYVGLGFQCCHRFNISLENGIFPCAMLVKELKDSGLKNKKWTFKESEVYHLDPKEVELFDQNFEPAEKMNLPSHEEFYILSHSQISIDAV